MVESWPLTTDMWDGEELAGPVPTLFASDPETACQAIVKDPVKAHADISKLLRVFFTPEHVNLEGALELVKTARYAINKWNKVYKPNVSRVVICVHGGRTRPILFPPFIQAR